MPIRAALKAFINRSTWQKRRKRQCKAPIFDFRRRRAASRRISPNCLRNQWLDKSRCLIRVKAQISRELDRLELLLEQIKTVETERDALISPKAKTARSRAPQAMLINLNGIGREFAAVLWSEGLYRSFSNRKQVAAYAGLAPTPWQSGSVDREQGVSKAGNPRLRTTLIQLAWLWLRHQPQSALALWFKERVRRNGGRLKKTTIVALARKLLVALWKYVTAGVVIDGAVMKGA
jgi:transposase